MADLVTNFTSTISPTIAQAGARIKNETSGGPVMIFAILAALSLLTLFISAAFVTRRRLKLRKHEREIIALQEKNTVARPVSKAMSPEYDSAIYLNEVHMRSRTLSQTSALYFVDSARKRMTIQIHKELLNVYGKCPKVGLLMMTAQSYYKSHTNTTEDVPAEALKAVDAATNRKTVISKLLTNDWQEGLPTSLIFNGNASSSSQIVKQNKGILIHITIGPKGGRMNISGVTLDIPPGALMDDTLVSLGLLWNEDFAPPLTKKQTMLSPMVLCQPSGLKFKKPVKLTFPHSAYRITSDWVPKVMKREGSLENHSQWETLTLADFSQMDVGEHRITLHLNHFTLYTLVGESKQGKTAAKLVHFVAFTNQLKRGSLFKPRIYCLNSYKDEAEEVQKLQNHFEGVSKLSDTSGLIVHDTEHDILVELVKLGDGWQHNGERTEVLPFENVWHGFQPHCTFVMRHEKTTAYEIICEFHVYQAGDDNRFAKLKIAEDMPMPSSPLTPTEEDPVEDLIRELIILLDPLNTSGSDAGDWRHLAEKLNVNVSRIRWLEIQSSPTRLLLETWLESKKPLSELRDILLTINRPDAAGEVDKRLAILKREVGRTVAI
ncbi:hypothetical protein DPMN_101549 [Dreissena polymorpha]|uniref:Netrin receptor UNC5 n=1 Tax=Dreissena polymorpha TaxID=45954 RepID=A0A9D4LHS4_DREPO|nr:hypothetical protein DPMN_101549 [Dreissena polymorpha]